MGGLGIDFNQWPTWLLVILITANLFKDQLGAVISIAAPTWLKDTFRLRAKRTLSQEEHKRLIEEILVNNQIQNRVAAQMQDERREQALIQIIQDKDCWVEERLTKGLDDIQVNQKQMIEVLTAIKVTSEQTKNILDGLYISLSRRGITREP